MRVQDWESTIQTIIDECKQGQARFDRVLAIWRAKLEKEPAELQPYQIDVIVREVRQRLSSLS